MTLREILDNVKQSEIYKLKADGKIVGLRVKYFNVNVCKFEYYDFELDIITNQGVKNFVNSINSSMHSIDLIHYNGLLASKEEIDGSIAVGNFETEDDVIKVLQPFIRIYRYKNNTYIYTIRGKTEDPDSTRVFYDIQISEEGKFVNVMCIREGNEQDWYEYIMQNEDDSEVFDGNGGTYSAYKYDRDKCAEIASEQWLKEYKEGGN